MAGAIFGQTLQKGILIGMHVETLIPNPDVTYNQFKDFFVNKYLPEWNKLFEGDMKVYFAEGERGADDNCVSLLWVFNSVEVRDKYFDKEGNNTELFNSRAEKFSQSIDEELNKLGTFSEKHYTDWIIQ